VARSLWVTEATVKFHLRNIYRKLDVTNRTEASHLAHVNGLVSTPDHEPAMVAATTSDFTLSTFADEAAAAVCATAASGPAPATSL
jgi:hypothetical protein